MGMRMRRECDAIRMSLRILLIVRHAPILKLFLWHRKSLSSKPLTTSVPLTAPMPLTGPPLCLQQSPAALAAGEGASCCVLNAYCVLNGINAS